MACGILFIKKVSMVLIIALLASCTKIEKLLYEVYDTNHEKLKEDTLFIARDGKFLQKNEKIEIQLKNKQIFDFKKLVYDFTSDSLIICENRTNIFNAYKVNDTKKMLEKYITVGENKYIVTKFAVDNLVSSNSLSYVYFLNHKKIYLCYHLYFGNKYQFISKESFQKIFKNDDYYELKNAILDSTFFSYPVKLPPPPKPEL